VIAALVAPFALGVLPTPADASCTPRDRLDRLTGFFAGWQTGDTSRMLVDGSVKPLPPFGFTLPRSSKPWPSELYRPASRRLASVRAWFRRRVAAGDQMTLLRVSILGNHGSATGGILAYRRTAPDIRRGHKVYGLAKFEVRCGGVSALGGGRSWWRPNAAIKICHPGRQLNGIRVCGPVPKSASARRSIGVSWIPRNGDVRVVAAGPARSGRAHLG
jgi:hypothetical protein